MDFKKTLFILPNLFTAAGLACGSLAILMCAAPDVTGDDVYRASLLLFFAILFDLFDGRVARMTRTQSAFGVEFDSLADLISFGVAPAVIAYRWSFTEIGTVGMVACIGYVLCGALRLARFNVMANKPKKVVSKTPGKYMLGLPIPVAASFVVALVVATKVMGGWPWLTSHGLLIKGIGYPVMVVVMFGLALLMVSSVKFRSFKDLRVTKLTVSLMLGLIGVCLGLWIFLNPAYILIGLIGLYLSMGFVEAIFNWPKRYKRESKI